jgi:hypothetical protein
MKTFRSLLLFFTSVLSLAAAADSMRQVYIATETKPPGGAKGFINATPGNDWVLVLDAATKNFKAPGAL